MVIYFLARIHLATLSAIRSDSQVRVAVIHYHSQASTSNGFDHLENIIRTEAFTTVILKVLTRKFIRFRFCVPLLLLP